MGKLFNELTEMKAAYDRKLKQEGEAAVKDAFKDLFDKYPEVTSVVWTQYTPYFNDGDACTFTVNAFCVKLKSRSKDPRKKEVDEAVRTLARELPNDVLESIFGDPVKIIATRQGFNITKYDPDY